MADWFDLQKPESDPSKLAPVAAPTVQKGKDWFDQNQQEVKAESGGAPGPMDYFRHYVGRYIPGALSAIGGAAAGAATDLIGAGAGAGLGSIAGQELQNEFPRAFGSGPKSAGDIAGQTAGDVVGNGIAPEVGGKVVDALKGGNLKVNLLSSRALRNTSGVQKAIGEDITEKGMNHADWYLSDGSAKRMPGGGPNTAANVLKDTDSLNAYKMQYGPGEAERVASHDLISSGYSPTAGTINPTKILQNFDGKKADVYKAAISDRTKQDIMDLMNTIKEGQDKANPPGNNIINYAKHKLVFALPLMASGHIGEGLGLAGGLVLGDHAISKAMSNPITAKAVIAAINTPQTAPQSGILSKIIQNGIRGSYVLYNGPEDKLEKAYVDDNGQLTTPRN